MLSITIQSLRKWDKGKTMNDIYEERYFNQSHFVPFTPPIAHGDAHNRFYSVKKIYVNGVNYCVLIVLMYVNTEQIFYFVNIGRE